MRAGGLKDAHTLSAPGSEFTRLGPMLGGDCALREKVSRISQTLIHYIPVLPRVASVGTPSASRQMQLITECAKYDDNGSCRMVVECQV